jgi:hypothetical protein
MKLKYSELGSKYCKMSEPRNLSGERTFYHLFWLSTLSKAIWPSQAPDLIKEHEQNSYTI